MSRINFVLRLLEHENSFINSGPGVSTFFFFSKLTFSKNSFRKTIRNSSRLDPGQDRRFVGPDLDPNCLQDYHESSKVTAIKERVKNRNVQSYVKLTSFLLFSSLSSLERLQFETLEEISVLLVRLKPLSPVTESLSLALVLVSFTVSEISLKLRSWVLEVFSSESLALSTVDVESLFLSSSEACFTSSSVTPWRREQNLLFVLFDLILYVPSTILQLNRDGSSWAETVLS